MKDIGRGTAKGDTSASSGQRAGRAALVLNAAVCTVSDRYRPPM